MKIYPNKLFELENLIEVDKNTIEKFNSNELVKIIYLLDELDKDDMIAAPMSWYSGYAYKDLDKGLIVEFGSAYCAQGMNAVDWALANLPVDIKTVGIIGNAGDYVGEVAMSNISFA